MKTVAKECVNHSVPKKLLKPHYYNKRRLGRKTKDRKKKRNKERANPNERQKKKRQKRIMKCYSGHANIAMNKLIAQYQNTTTM